MPFTASIVQRNFVYIPDTVLQLAGASWIRQLPISTMPWSRIRIGVLCAVTPNVVALAGQTITDSLFLLGVCSGAVLPGSNYNTLTFVGASLNGLPTVSASRTLTFAANSGNAIYNGQVGAAFCKQEGVINSQGANFGTALVLPVVGTQAGGLILARYPRRTIIVVDITKQQGESGSCTVTTFQPTAVSTVDYRPDDLQAALDLNIATPTIRGQAFTQMNSVTIQYSPLVGDADTLEVHWGNTTFPLEISAIGATIILPTFYSSTFAPTGLRIGTANESFEEYATQAGSINESTFLSGGSGWTSNGSVVYDTSIFAGNSANSSNFAAQAYSQYVGTTNMPDETFEQYGTGTVIPGTTINLGTYWPSAATGTVYNELPGPQTTGQFVGTTATPADNWELYVVNNGSTFGQTSVFNAGSFFGTAGGIYSGGSYNQILFGTTGNNPFPAINAVYGTTAGNAYYGTTIGLPLDTFEQYGTGAVTSGVTINAGTGFSTFGSTYAFSI